MANAEDEPSVESVKSFIVRNGGRVRNVDLVSHYSHFLKHGQDKGTNKKKFSQIVNEVATIKQIEGEKYLVLKKKYKKEVEKLTFYPPPVEVDAPVEEAPREEQRERKVGRLHNAGEFLNGSGNQEHLDYQSESLAYNREELPTFQTFQPLSVQNNNSSNEEFQERKDTEHHEIQPAGDVGGGVLEMDSNLQDLSEQIKKLERNYMLSAEEQENTRNIDLEDQNEATHVKNSTGQSENVYQEGDTINDKEKIQVKDVTQKNSQDSMVVKPNSAPDSHRPPVPKITTPESESSSTEHHDDDEEPPRSETAESIVSSESMDEHPSPAKLGPLDRKWMLACAFGKIPDLNDLLKQDPTLITRRDFISGFTVMHWGAKLGKKEMIRMAVTNGVDVNMRTQGGYTALHIAAMHNKEAIMQLLIKDFDANIEIRDYSGRKPHHHLKSTASSYIKKPEIVQAVATQDDLIKRQSKIGSFFRSQLRNSFRSSFRIWGSADALNSDRSKSTSHTPPKTPPSSPRLRSKSAQHELRSDNYLMPPPNPFHGRKSKKKAGRRSRSPDPAGMKRSGSDSDLLDDSPHHHIYII